MVEVLELYQDKTFENLFRKLINDETEIKRKTEAMYEYYTQEQEKQYGVLGIKIKIDTEDLKMNIEKFRPFNEQEEVDKKIMLKYINDFDDVLTRENVTYLLETDESEEINIKEDENSGVKWVPISEVISESSEPWMRDRVYSKIINKMKKDGII